MEERNAFHNRLIFPGVMHTEVFHKWRIPVDCVENLGGIFETTDQRCFCYDRRSDFRSFFVIACGDREPLTWVPYGQTKFGLPSCVFSIIKEFRTLRSATKGFALGTHKPFEKGLTENFYLLKSRQR